MKNKGIIQPLVLASVLASGFVVVWGVVGMWVVGVAESGQPSSQHLTFLADGTPLVMRYVGSHGEREFFDLEGNPVPAPEGKVVGMLHGASLPATPSASGVPDLSWGERIRSFADGRAPAVYWYFVTDGLPDGTAYFVGYDSLSRSRVGYLGTAGLREGPLPAEELFPFHGAVSGPHSRVLCSQPDHSPTAHPQREWAGQAPRGSVSTWDVYVVGRDHKIYHADLHSRTVHVALDEPQFRSAALVAGPIDLIRGTPHRLGVRLDEAILVLDERGRELKRFPIPEALRDRPFRFVETTASEGLLYWTSPPDSLADRVEYELYWEAPDGHSRKAQVALPSRGTMRSLQTLGGLVAPAPLVLGGIIAAIRPPELLEAGLTATYPEALSRALTEYWAALVIAQVAALALAVLCYRRQVRYGASKAERVVWPLFVLCVGLPGWIGYRFGRSWPVLESCPECHVRVPRDRGGCAGCETEFPRPALKGTEVFA
jgi:hypothetical protein